MALLPKPKLSGFKAGPNKMEQAIIKKLIVKGLTAKAISDKLKIRIESINSWMPKKKAVKKVTKKEV